MPLVPMMTGPTVSTSTTAGVTPTNPGPPPAGSKAGDIFINRTDGKGWILDSSGAWVPLPTAAHQLIDFWGPLGGGVYNVGDLVIYQPTPTDPASLYYALGTPAGGPTSQVPGTGTEWLLLGGGGDANFYDIDFWTSGNYDGGDIVIYRPKESDPAKLYYALNSTSQRPGAGGDWLPLSGDSLSNFYDIDFWTSGSYNGGDIVIYQQPPDTGPAKLYYALKDTNGVPGVSTDWQLLGSDAGSVNVTISTTTGETPTNPGATVIPTPQEGSQFINRADHLSWVYAPDPANPGQFVWEPTHQIMPGRHIYVGNGPFNPNNPAAPNWGMPNGTLPNPALIEPNGGDIYIDTNGGDITVFQGGIPQPLSFAGVSQRLYVGAGPFNPAAPAAANNWGMPAGTQPDPTVTEPKPGDVYIDTVGGDVVVFT